MKWKAMEWMPPDGKGELAYDYALLVGRAIVGFVRQTGNLFNGYFRFGEHEDVYTGSSIDEAKKAVEDRAREFARAILGINTHSDMDQPTDAIAGGEYRASFSELSPGPQSL